MAILTSMTCPAAKDLSNLALLSCQTSCELAKKMNCNQKTILNHFHSMGFAEKLRVWVPHELSENNKENCLQIASQYLTPPLSKMQSQTALFVPNRYRR